MLLIINVFAVDIYHSTVISARVNFICPDKNEILIYDLRTLGLVSKI